MVLTKKKKHGSSTQSFAELDAESRKVNIYDINLQRNSTIHQRASARKKRHTF